MVSRQRFRRRFRRRKASSEGTRKEPRDARDEPSVVAERERAAARQLRAEATRRRMEDARMAIKGTALETRRRLRPITNPLTAGLARAAPYISGALMLLVRIPVGLIAILLDVTQDVAGWTRARVGPAAAGVSFWLARMVTPVRALAVVVIAAAVALAASQFVDYRGVAVGEDQYQGEVGTVAPVPLTDLKATGSAHLYAMVPLAVIAIALVPLTVRGRWRLGRAISLIGLIGIAVGLLIDAPEGLDAGRAGISYLGTDAHLIEGFWAQMASSGTLVLCGLLLGLYVKQASAHEGWLERRRGRAPRQAGSRKARRRTARRARTTTEARLEPGT